LKQLTKSADQEESLALEQITHDCQLIRIDKASAITTLGKSSINLWVIQGRFPKPIALSPTVKVWRLKDIEDWINAHAEVRS